VGATPLAKDFHRIHHSAEPKLGNSNDGVVFPFWDMAFGTHSDPLSVVVGDAGMRDDPIPRQFIEEPKSPITYGDLVARRRAV
jgi:sterol desaturase/sphingolipid hydroxylase (fatty acid hydroxylase superfamily)